MFLHARHLLFRGFGLQAFAWGEGEASGVVEQAALLA